MASTRGRTTASQINEIDLHGLDSTQAEMRILRILDEYAGRAGLVLRFVHGKGTGALADLVERIGARDPRVASVDKSFLNPGMTSYTLSDLKKPHTAPRISAPAHWDQPPPPVRKRKR